MTHSDDGGEPARPREKFGEAVEQALNDALAGLRDGPGLLPVLGAGFSAWEVGRPSQQEQRKLLDGCPVVDVPGIVSHILGGIPGADGKVRTLADLDGAAPTWLLFLAMCAALGETKYRHFDAGMQGFSQVAEALRQSHPRRLSKLLDYLFSSCRPNQLHRLLADFPVRTVVTTNYDTCVEQACQAIGTRFHTVSTDADLRGLGTASPLVLHIHGAARPDPQAHTVVAKAQAYVDHHVLTDWQYWQFPNGQHLEGVGPVERSLMCDYLRVLFATSQPLFLGYSLSDFNIVAQLHRLAPSMQLKPIAVTSSAPQEHAATWRVRGFEWVQCDAGRFLRELWRRYFGCAYDTFERRAPPGAPGAPVERDLQKAAVVLRSRAERDPEWGRRLRSVANQAMFRGSDLPVDAGQLDFMLAQRWLRRVRSGDTPDSSFYSMPVELRVALAGYPSAGGVG